MWLRNFMSTTIYLFSKFLIPLCSSMKLAKASDPFSFKFSCVGCLRKWYTSCWRYSSNCCSFSWSSVCESWFSWLILFITMKSLASNAHLPLTGIIASSGISSVLQWSTLSHKNLQTSAFTSVSDRDFSPIDGNNASSNLFTTIVRRACLKISAN